MRGRRRGGVRGAGNTASDQIVVTSGPDLQESQNMFLMTKNLLSLGLILGLPCTVGCWLHGSRFRLVCEAPLHVIQSEYCSAVARMLHLPIDSHYYISIFILLWHRRPLREPLSCSLFAYHRHIPKTVLTMAGEQSEAEKEMGRMWRAWKTAHEMCHDRVPI